MDAHLAQLVRQGQITQSREQRRPLTEELRRSSDGSMHQSQPHSRLRGAATTLGRTV